MGPHFMLLLSIYVLYSNVTYIYPVSCLMEIKLLKKCFIFFQIVYVFAEKQRRFLAPLATLFYKVITKRSRQCYQETKCDVKEN